ncbi:epidermal growth factor-like protein isoform X1 [Helicoverpa armigera]|uniref:epidermal growth factor-like protein isoform X1 n=2 Tax=Helicoverpa armigera TaxID=29058 RepID=UPI0030834934
MLPTKAAHVVFLVINVVQFVEISVTLKLGDKGVCEKPVHNITGVLASRKNIQHMITGIKSLEGDTRVRRSVLQKNIYPNAEDVTIRPVCCSQYYHDEELDQCLPVCNMGCINGDCVDVDKCVCEPPLMFLYGACVQPVCNSICVNGRCVGTNRCECSPGHAPDPRDAFKCNPICDTPCVNGTCVAHNKCICSVGYEPTGNSAVCRPTCAGCDHGQCVAPNQCICSVGYERINSTCKPQCSFCSNGDCVAPGKCECHEGYELKGEDCAPICSPPCNNGQCLAPDNCSCNPGYNLTATGCEPICAKPCVNGKCSAPNFCSCDAEYRKHDTDEYTCYKPVHTCTPPCNNGQCRERNQCLCHRGYVRTDNGCKPRCCESGCENGHCNKPKHHTKWHKRKNPEYEPVGLFSTLSVAGIEGMWVAIAAGGLFLLLLIIVMIQLLCKS